MKTMEQLEASMLEMNLPGYFAALKPFAKNAVRIALEKTEAIAIGASKFGGQPDLPAHVDWFRMDAADIPLSFIAQINFAEVNPYDLDNKLPERGMLYFFYDCSPDGMPWGFDPEDAAGWKVYFYDGDMSLLERKAVPGDLEENGWLFGAARMVFESYLELPSYDSDLCENAEFPEEEEEQYWTWLDDQVEEQSNKLLGHSDNIQSGMELECEYVTNGISCGTPDGYQEAKQRGLNKNAGRWNLLLQVESNEEIDMMWGDMGRLYLWITDEDLAARNFEKTWLILQCG